MRPRKRCLWLIILLAGVVVLTSAAVVWQQRASRLPKRFAAVVQGQLYRSGSVTPAQLERLCRDYGIRHVICLLNDQAPQTQAERAAAERLDIQWCNVPLPGNGASTPADRRRIRDLLADRSAGATLVHCAAGVNRTGLAIGLYRLHQQGWTLEQVMRELRAFDFEDAPHHENLRQALAAEAAAAESAATQPLHAP